MKSTGLLFDDFKACISNSFISHYFIQYLTYSHSSLGSILAYSPGMLYKIQNRTRYRTNQTLSVTQHYTR